MTIFKSAYQDVAVPDQTITQHIFAGINPDATILVDGPTGRSLTGAEFMHAVKSLAGGLSARGWGAGKVVALMAPNMPEYTVVFHAACWAGGTITTVNPTYTAPEVTHQLNDANADVLVTISAFAETAKAAIAGTGVSEIVVIDDAPEGMIPMSRLMGAPLVEQAPVDVATHIAALPYSSGTTGLPKGVMLSHQNMTVNLNQVAAMIAIEAGEMTVAFLPFFHAYGMQTLQNLYLLKGAGLVTMPRFDLAMFLDLITQYQTPRLFIVPPVALALAKHPLIDNYDLGCIKHVMSAAAPLGADVSQAMGERLNANAVQGYGMTELSPVSHIPPFNKGRPGASGTSIPNTECRIVDPETLADMPRGEDGELWVRGPQVMRGYLNNPKATAETIVDGGWLRTGDIAHFDDDGYLYVTDRLKELIKYKAFQVAPAEVEAALLTHDAIADAAVIGKPDAEAGEVPMAFIVAAQGHDAPDLAAVESYLSQRLAHYKQVRALEVVEQIPKSASGKILRRLLRAQIAS